MILAAAVLMTAGPAQAATCAKPVVDTPDQARATHLQEVGGGIESGNKLLVEDRGDYRSVFQFRSPHETRLPGGAARVTVQQGGGTPELDIDTCNGTVRSRYARWGARPSRVSSMSSGISQRGNDAPGSRIALPLWPLRERQSPIDSAGRRGDGANAMEPKGKKEGRREPRKATLSAAIIVFVDAVTVMNCSILDMSRSGARVRIGTNAALPPRFFLINLRDHMAHDASLAWQKGLSAGLRFEKSFILSADMPADLQHLRKIWFDHATR